MKKKCKYDETIDAGMASAASDFYYVRHLRPILREGFRVPSITSDNQFEYFETLLSVPPILLAASVKIHAGVKTGVIDTDVFEDIFTGSYETLRETLKGSSKLRQMCNTILQDDYDRRLET